MWQLYLEYLEDCKEALVPYFQLLTFEEFCENQH